MININEKIKRSWVEDNFQNFKIKECKIKYHENKRGKTENCKTLI